MLPVMRRVQTELAQQTADPILIKMLLAVSLLMTLMASDAFAAKRPPSNKAPVVNNQSFNVDENSANGTAVGNVVATDANGDALTYSITAGNTGTAFAIGASKGALTVANATVLDFETTPSFSLTVRVADPGGLSDTAIVTVALNDVAEADPIAHGRSLFNSKCVG